MDFNYYEEVKKNFLEEYNDNLEKIDTLKEEITLFSVNNLYNKITRVFAFSVIPWTIEVIFIVVSKFSFNIPFEILSLLIAGIPSLIGYCFEEIVSKGANLKKVNDSYFDVFYKEIRKELELNKMLNRNKILTFILDDINNEDMMLRYVYKNYDISAKSKDVISSKIRIDIINRQQQMLEEKESYFDILVTKQFLSNNFADVRNKLFRIKNVVTSFLGGGFISLILLNLPNIVSLQLNSQINFNIFSNIVFSFCVGSILSGGIYLKWCNDRIKVFKEINDELGEEKLSFHISDDEKLDYSLKLKEFMNEICEIKIKLEKNRYDLDNIDLSNEHESKKINNYSYNHDSSLDKSEHEFNDDEEISMENSVHLSRKRVKDRNNNL